MQKKYLLILISLCSATFSESATAPGRWGRFSWSQRKTKRAEKKQLEGEQQEKKVILESMKAEWRQLKKILDQQIQDLSEALGGISSDKVKDELKEFQEKNEKIKGEFDSVAAGFFSRYLPNKLLSDYPYLQENDELIKQAKIYTDDVKFILKEFDSYLINRLKRLKRGDRPKAPVGSRTISLQKKVSNDWSDVEKTVVSSAKKMATDLGVDLPASESKQELLDKLNSNNKLVNEELEKIRKKIDQFEDKWTHLFKEFKELDKKEAVEMFNYILTEVKPKLIGEFKNKIVDHWKDPRIHELQELKVSF